MAESLYKNVKFEENDNKLDVGGGNKSTPDPFGKVMANLADVNGIIFTE